MSRNGKQMSRFNGFADQLARDLDIRDAVFDGEVIAADDTGRPQFYDLLQQSRRLNYVVFDLLWLNSTDLRTLPLAVRRRRLRAMPPEESRALSAVLSVKGRGRKLFELTCTNDLRFFADEAAKKWPPRGSLRRPAG